MKLLERYYPVFLKALLLFISITGMIEYKERKGYEAFFWPFAVLFWSVAGYIIFSWVFNRWKQYKKLKNEHTKAELALLKSKIDPHFFFNTLNNLYGLTVEKSDKAPEVILKLSDIMRYTIYDGEKEHVSLKEEITYLEKYLEIHKIRYQKKVAINFTHNIEDENQPITPLLLIILLENAIKHGIAHLTDDAYLTAKLTVKNKLLSFYVENNYDHHKDTNNKGIGLSNLSRRLQLIYPEKHRLELSTEENVYKAQLHIHFT